MNNYVTGKLIKELREKNNMTQLELGILINVSDKTISKWETGKGLPDISLINPLAVALKISVIELMRGEYVTNKNISSNMIKSNFYVCPICGNIIYSIGESTISCCGVTLPKLEADTTDEEHKITCERIENEYYVNIDHQMTKGHYISFISYVTCDKCEIKKLYPEQTPEARFAISGKGNIYIYCNKSGLIKKSL